MKLAKFLWLMFFDTCSTRGVQAWTRNLLGGPFALNLYHVLSIMPAAQSWWSLSSTHCSSLWHFLKPTELKLQDAHSWDTGQSEGGVCFSSSSKSEVRKCFSVYSGFNVGNWNNFHPWTHPLVPFMLLLLAPPSRCMLIMGMLKLIDILYVCKGGWFLVWAEVRPLPPLP